MDLSKTKISYKSTSPLIHEVVYEQPIEVSASGRPQRNKRKNG